MYSYLLTFEERGLLLCLHLVEVKVHTQMKAVNNVRNPASQGLEPVALLEGTYGRCMESVLKRFKADSPRQSLSSLLSV